MLTTADTASLFMLGLFGTGHCIGMCGPLVVAFPGQTGRFTAHLAYHTGRLITYALIGGLMGAAGSGLVRLATYFGSNPMLWMSRIQVGISLVAGLFLLFFGLSRIGFIAEPDWLAIAAPNRLLGWKALIRKTGDKRGNRELVLLGLFLGGLPCGLSYAAFAKAIACEDIVCGALLAFIFGLGTLPGLLGIGVGAAFFFHRFRQQMDILAGLIMLGMAAMLLVKALEVFWG